MRFTTALLIVFSALQIASPQYPSASSAANKAINGSQNTITSQRLQAHLEFIADDLLEGRNTPSRGLDLAALYIASQLKLWGVEPGGDNGTYFQNISRVVQRIDVEKTYLKVGDTELAFDKDFQAYLPGFELEAKIVYVGNGFIIPSMDIDPYKGVDVKDKILLVLSGAPIGVNEEEIYNGTLKDAEAPEMVAKRLGAKAVFVLKRESGGTSMTIGGAIPFILIKSSALQILLKDELVSPVEMLSRNAENKAGNSFELSSNKLVSIKVASIEETVQYRNVIGIVRGTDPILKGEYVAFGAHYDHVGTNNAGSGDKVFNGADDDGSGTVGVLEIAHAFAMGKKPKRSALFVWHAGEEKGLWGSEYFVNHPTVPIVKIVTQLNIDMIGRSRKPGDKKPENAELSDQNSIYVIGSRMLSDDLGDAVANVNKRLYKLNLDYKYDDPKDPNGFYYRSDHYNYAQKGIPIAFFFNGVHEDYHGLGDEVSKIDFVRMEKVARTVYAIGFELANSAKRPKVTKPIN